MQPLPPKMHSNYAIHIFLMEMVEISHFYIPYPHGQLGTQVPNNYFYYCKVIMQRQQYFNHYSTPMNNINGNFGIINVVCRLCYIHISS